MSSVNLQPFSIPASACVEALARNRVDHVVTVPDWVQLALHQRLEEGLPGVRLVGCCSENQVVTVAAGLALGGKRPLLMMQNHLARFKLHCLQLSLEHRLDPCSLSLLFCLALPALS
mgnify:CR=1 FL=1